MTASIQGNFCASPGLSDPVHGSGCFGHTKIFPYVFLGRILEERSEKGRSFFICLLIEGENKIVQNADKIVY